MARRGLILYASITGNTEKVAMRFKAVFGENGWECDTLKITKHTDIDNLPFRLDDYDLLCAGSPVWSGIPPKEILDDHYGVLWCTRLFREGRMPPITEGYGPKKGVAFVTYGGTRWGPPEAIPSLDVLTLRMEDARIRCIGKFACAGGHTGGHGHSLDKLSSLKGWSIEDTGILVYRYIQNPEHPDFAELSEEDRKLVAETAAERAKELAGPNLDRSHSWHWDIANRPNERDLRKAEIFLEEILDDYYGGGVDAAPMAQYVCIA